MNVNITGIKSDDLTERDILTLKQNGAIMERGERHVKGLSKEFQKR
jgi:hypothetical protein